MSDIFISYEKTDLSTAELLARALGAHGWSVFWDRTIAIGDAWRRRIGKELDDANCIVVLWSKNSVESDWVHEEADEGKRRGVLVPLLIDDTPRPPFGFRGIQTGNLVNWDGPVLATPFQKLVTDLTKLIGPPKETKPVAAPTSNETRYWQTVYPKSSFLRKAYLSYRKGDSEPLIDRLIVELRDHPNWVVVTNEAKPAFPKEYLTAELKVCEVFLAFIGSKWLGGLDDPDDYVRNEISLAINLNVWIIPVVLGNAPFPRKNLLPDNLHSLAVVPSVRISETGIGFRDDVGSLFSAMQR
jgi:TIR domain